MSIHCVEIRDGRGLAEIEQDWWDLWQRSPTAAPFQTPAWLVSWWQAFAPGELFVVSAWRRGRLVGLAPLYRDGRRLLPLGISLSDYLDVLIDPQCADAAGQALLDHIGRCSVEWDEWDLAELEPGAAALQLPSPPGFDDSLEPQSPCPVLTLPSTSEGLQDVLPARKRRKLRLARNRAARRGQVIVERVAGEWTGRAFADLVRLHEARWRSRDKPGVLSDPRVQRFHSMALGRFCGSDLLRIYVLRIAGQAIGIYYGFQHRDRAYGYLTGFDPGYEFESPGTILTGHAIEEAVREGAREFHFLRGNEAYKYEWGARDRWNQRRVLRRMHAHAET